MTTLSEIAGNHVGRIVIPVAMASATTNDEYEGIILPFNAVITGVKWLPGAAVTANGTNFTTLSIRNRKGDATGSVLPASRSYAATNSAAHIPESMTLSVTASDLLANSGDVITAQRIATASGLVLPAGVVEVSYKAR